MSDQSIDIPAVPSEVIYKELPHLPGYRIGSDGSVWSERGRHQLRTGVWKRLKGGRLPVRGHLYVNLATKKGGWPYLIHRLVLEAFVGPCPEGMEACHDPDPDPANNRLENLRWDTHAGNMKDAVRLSRMPKGSSNRSSKLVEADIHAIRFLRSQGWSISRIAAEFPVCFEAVRRIVNGTAWKHV